MGKGLLLIVIGGIMAGSSLMFQTQKTALETTKVQTEYQETVLAREIARSAYSVAFRKAQAAGNNLDLAISNVNGTLQSGEANFEGVMAGSYQGGAYAVQAYTLDGQNVVIRSTGYFGNGEFTINENYNVKLLTVKSHSRITIDFLESMAGYCSAVFMQRFLPYKGEKKPPMSGNYGNAEKKGYALGKARVSDDEKYWVMPPEMLLNSGHNRTGAELRVTPDDLSLAPETRVNFFIGVDKNCSEEGIWEDEYNESRYDYIHSALEEDTQNMLDLQEGKYAMIEQNKTDDQQWRIAFEDLEGFSDAQLNDVKANSYGGNWNDGDQTYGGSGWTEEDALGYHKLKDFGNKPDFSDQVIQVTLTPCGGPCAPPA